MTLRILAIGDTANNAYLLSKIVKKSKIDIINFPRIGAAKYTYANNIQFFESYLISKQVKKIKKIKSNYDLCFVSSWEGARIAFLANLNYVFFFVGGNVYEQPFIKNAKTSYLKEPIHKKKFFERWFLKQVLNNAVSCGTWGGSKFVNELKKFHSNVFRMDMLPVDENLFKKTKTIKKNKTKFTFLSPQRQGLEKGMDIIWKALDLTKSDFEILQVDWFDERTLEEKEISRKFRENLPKKMKLIPMIKWEDMPSYYSWADAVMGQMRFRHGAIEREAIICGTPVLQYGDSEEKFLIGDKEYEAKFLPKSRDPNILANTIDKLVNDGKFRDQLYAEELEFVKMLTNSELIGSKWDDIFEHLHKKHKKIDNPNSKLIIFLMNLSSKFFEKVIYKKKWKYKER